MMFASAVVIWLLATGAAMPTAGRQDDVLLIKNAEIPANQKAGRTIELAEIGRITDKEGDFRFRRPHKIVVGSDGSLYLMDKDGSRGMGIVHQFREGRFLRTLVRVGQGPGEFPNGVADIVAAGDALIMNRYPDALIWVDAEGRRIREIPSQKIQRLLGFVAPCIIGTIRSTASKDVKSGIRTWLYPLRAMDEQGRLSPIPMTLFVKQHFKVMDDGIAISPLTEILSTPLPPDRLVLSQTTEYQIMVLDCSSLRLKLQFNREYRPVSMPRDRRITKTFPAVENDVQRLFTRKDRIWVYTSTVKNGHPLIDVFDREGVYVDAFYLPLDVRSLEDKWGERYAMCVDGDLLYAIRTDEDGEMALITYRIEDRRP